MRKMDSLSYFKQLKITVHIFFIVLSQKRPNMGFCASKQEMGVTRGPIGKSESIPDVPTINKTTDIKSDIVDSITTVQSNIIKGSPLPKQKLQCKQSIVELRSPLTKNLDYPILQEEKYSERSQEYQDWKVQKFDLGLRMTPIKMDNDLLFRNDMNASVADNKLGMVGMRQQISREGMDVRCQ